jgi:hypothetical protein
MSIVNPIHHYRGQLPFCVIFLAVKREFLLLFPFSYPFLFKSLFELTFKLCFSRVIAKSLHY